MKHDWYQTDSCVVINVLTKNCSKDDAIIDITKQSVKVIRSTDGNTEEVSLRLLRPIKDQEATYKILSTKIEVKLPKIDTERWSSLEPAVELPNPDPVFSKNWDTIVCAVDKEEGEDKPEGDGALNELFKKIYKDADPNTKKAMNKSYMESGGTVLSTNWGEVGGQKVDVKAPDGMEYKKWN